MDAAVTAAIIGAAGAVVAALIAVGGRKKKPPPPTVGFPTGDANEQIAPYEIEEIAFTTIMAVDGHITSTREYRGVRARNSGTQLQNQEIPYKSNASSGSLETPVVRDVHGLPTQLRIDTQTPQLVDGSIMLLGLLRSDTRTDFTVSQNGEGQFLMTRKEVLEAYKNSPWKTEYQSLSTAVPTRLLKIVVAFPDTYTNMTPSSVVFGEQEEVHKDETNRVKNALVLVNGRACLTVEDPKIGLKYAISWVPPI